MPMSAPARWLSLLLLSAPAVIAQEVPPSQFTAVQLDSGRIDHSPTGPQSIAIGTVQVAGSAAVQLWFGACSLPTGSRLRLVGARDGAVQWFTADSLADYSHASAWFNGDRVQVELWPGPGTTNNRVVVSQVRTEGQTIQTDVVCGPSDARVLSSDPRVGRLDGCCTAFLVDARNLVTAGHCIGGIGGQLVNFNVPLSDALGNAQYPPPQDQYALRPGSLTSVNGGLGNDYAVMATMRNSNTGLYPGEAQGSWFQTALANTSPQPVTWTVTGYGTSSVNATWSLAQKTGNGPRQSTSASLLQFFISVTGCNSGSPVIGTTGQVHGVVTHGGCSGTGGSNYGTGFALPAFGQALATLQQSYVAGTFSTFGSGCGSSNGTPVLALSGTPDIGGSVTFTVTQTDPTSDNPGILAIGDSDVSYSGGPLPADLGFAGMPGCSLLVSTTMVFAQTTNFGSSQLTLAVPPQPALLAAHFYAQHFAIDAQSTLPLPAVSSNGARLTIGN